MRRNLLVLTYSPDLDPSRGLAVNGSMVVDTGAALYFVLCGRCASCGQR